MLSANCITASACDFPSGGTCVTQIGSQQSTKLYFAAEAVCVSSIEGKWRQIFRSSRANGGPGQTRSLGCAHVLSAQPNNLKELYSHLSIFQSKRCPRFPNSPGKKLAQAAPDQNKYLRKRLLDEKGKMYITVWHRN